MSSTARLSRAPIARLAADLPDMILERVVIEYLVRARSCHELQIINGLERGMLTRALAGEDVGTMITKA